MIEATWQGHTEIVELLLKQEGIDINIQDILYHENSLIFWNLFQTFNNTALIYAAWKGHKDIVELLLKQEGIDVNIKII